MQISPFPLFNRYFPSREEWERAHEGHDIQERFPAEGNMILAAKYCRTCGQMMFYAEVFVDG